MPKVIYVHVTDQACFILLTIKNDKGNGSSSSGTLELDNNFRKLVDKYIDLKKLKTFEITI